MEVPSRTLMVVSWGWGVGWEQPLKKACEGASLRPVSASSLFPCPLPYLIRLCVCICVRVHVHMCVLGQ